MVEIQKEIESNINVCLWCRYCNLINETLICKKENKKVTKNDTCDNWRYKF